MKQPEKMRVVHFGIPGISPFTPTSDLRAILANLEASPHKDDAPVRKTIAEARRYLRERDKENSLKTPVSEKS